MVTSPLWAQELSLEHLLEIARTHTDRQQASFSTQRVSRFCLPIVAMPSLSYNLPFGVPLFPPHYITREHSQSLMLVPLRIQVNVNPPSSIFLLNWLSHYLPIRMTTVRVSLPLRLFKVKEDLRNYNSSQPTQRSDMRSRSISRFDELRIHLGKQCLEQRPA